jgi:hypothetical protein
MASIVQTATRFDGVAMAVVGKLGSQVGGVDLEMGAYEDGSMLRLWWVDMWRNDGMAKCREILLERAQRAWRGLRIVEVIDCQIDGGAADWKTYPLGRE